MKKIYNINYLNPEYITNLNTNTTSISMVNKTKNVETVQEANNKEQNISPLSQTSDEEKKLTTLLLTKNNSLETVNHTLTTIVNTYEKPEDNNEGILVTIDSFTNSNILMNNEEEEDKTISISKPDSFEYETNKTKPVSKSPSIISSVNNNKKPKIKHSKSTSHIINEKQSSSLRKTKSLSSITENKKSSPKYQQKQKFLKKLKHKKQPKVIYPIPVNPDLSFVPLYKKNLNETKIKSRVKHADMENTYKKLKFEIQQKSK